MELEVKVFGCKIGSAEAEGRVWERVAMAWEPVKKISGPRSVGERLAITWEPAKNDNKVADEEV